MRRAHLLGLTLALSTLAGCGPVLHRELLGESIQSFSGRMKNSDKVWIASAGESDSCHAACTGCGKGESKGGLFSSLGGSSKPGSSPYDDLAHEVFANYLTTRHKARVIESHRHNYATELNAETHRKIEVTADNAKVSTTSCEDLCLLDEAKKRKADKVLVYRIVEMRNDELTIHFRLSDVTSGVVESAQTLHIKGDQRAADISWGANMSVAPRRSSQSSSRGED